MQNGGRKDTILSTVNLDFLMKRKPGTRALLFSSMVDKRTIACLGALDRRELLFT